MYQTIKEYKKQYPTKREQFFIDAESKKEQEKMSLKTKTLKQLQEEVDAKEIEWIAKYDSTDPKKGYNIDKGGHVISEACRKAAEKFLFKAGVKLEGKMLETARNNGIRAAKPIIQIDKFTGETIAEFPSIIEASRTSGCDRRAIQRQLKGEYGKMTPRSFSNLKYIWRYKEVESQAA